MNDETINKPSLYYYFVDEAGDPILFNRFKDIIVGREGCSVYFMLGLLDISDPISLERELDELRVQLLADPYFKGVPSMRFEKKKTAVFFHAKDDLPEVRREVYSLLMRHELRFFAVIRDKRRIAQLVQAHNQKTPTYRYHPHQLYDRCVSHLFKDRLYKEYGYSIYFATRGAKNRTLALKAVLETARSNFRRSSTLQGSGPIDVFPLLARQSAGLQAADYFLWALQRLYEKNEGRYWEYIWPSVKLVHDIDDLSQDNEGTIYSQENPLTAAIRAKKTPGI